jgi:stage II sporulation protein D
MREQRRASLGLALLAGALMLTATPLVSGARADHAVGAAQLVISGHGFGQGLGLSQWGAEERAVAGETTARILRFYYPGTALGSTRTTSVRVLVARRARVSIGSEGATAMRDTEGRVTRLLPGRHLFAAADARSSTASVFPVQLTTNGALLTVDGTSYHGALTLIRSGRQLEVVNEVPLELYVADVVSSECPGSWLPAALRGQAVASRTFAVANLHPRRPFDLYADDRSQNYRGTAKEFPSALAAADATRSQILLFKGHIIEAFFSASDGGRTNNSLDAWGIIRRLPYLVSRPDPFDALSPDRDWGPVTVPLTELGRLFPRLPRSIAAVTVVRNDAGRAARVVFTSTQGRSVALDGYVFQQRIGLRSTYLSSVRVES